MISFNKNMSKTKLKENHKNMRTEKNLELAVLGSFITFLRLLRQNVAAISGSLWDKLMH